MLCLCVCGEREGRGVLCVCGVYAMFVCVCGGVCELRVCVCVCVGVCVVGVSTRVLGVCVWRGCGRRVCV